MKKVVKKDKNVVKKKTKKTTKSKSVVKKQKIDKVAMKKKHITSIVKILNNYNHIEIENILSQVKNGLSATAIKNLSNKRSSIVVTDKDGNLVINGETKVYRNNM